VKPNDTEKVKDNFTDKVADMVADKGKENASATKDADENGSSDESMENRIRINAIKEAILAENNKRF